MSNRDRVVVYIVLFFLASISSYYVLKIVKQAIKTHINKNYNPDSFGNYIIYKKYNKNGLVHIFIRAKSFVHFEYKNRIKFISPKIIIHGDNKTVWRIRADRGSSLYGDKIIYLSGNIVVHRVLSGDKKNLVILTNKATIFPKKKIIKTKSLVKIKEKGFDIRAVGADVNLNSGVIHLLSHVNEKIESS